MCANTHYFPRPGIYLFIKYSYGQVRLYDQGLLFIWSLENKISAIVLNYKIILNG